MASKINTQGRSNIRDVAIYIRVSTEEQVKEGYSISAQKQKLKAYCIAQGWGVAGVYVDEGISAKDMNRPQLQQMIKDIKSDKIDCVLVYRLDRLTRSVLDLYKLLETFEEHDCKFKSATEVFETTTALGRMFITIVAAMAQWERENTGERIRFGLQEKARQGKWAVNLAPFGYEIKGDYLEIIESEAAVVRSIFDTYLSGIGMSKLALDLNAKGITTKTDSSWTSNKIRYILTNPTYTGTIRWNYRVNQEQYFEVEDAVPVIIEKDIFEHVQKIISARRTNHPRAATSEFIFSGVAKCARCGSPLAGKYGYSKRGEKINRPRSYYCTKQKLGLCDMRNVSELHLEHQFLEELSTWDIKANEVPEQHQPPSYAAEKQRIEKELEGINKRRKKWQYAWANEKISDEDFSLRMEEESQKEKPLKEQLEKMPDTVEETNIDESELLDILANIQLNWRYMTPIEKKNFIVMFVSVLTVDKTGPNGKADSVKIVEMELF